MFRSKNICIDPKKTLFRVKMMTSVCTSFADLHGQFGEFPLKHRFLLLWEVFFHLWFSVLIKWLRLSGSIFVFYYKKNYKIYIYIYICFIHQTKFRIFRMCLELDNNMHKNPSFLDIIVLFKASQ